ncbi:MAG: TetR/AcrR family transcriptional regulator C-terminal domain-containing protein [Oscillospiraceae bacterium]|nr:TetR/AcrR family transcriptional regulator C-terminal domain-containing protein [Oscillospiraceae bacterium]
MKHEITSYNTKKMIAETFKTLMEKKTVSKITVSEIIKECSINRKTFYYHFEDIYALLRWIFEDEIIAKIKEYDFCSDYEKVLLFIGNYFFENNYIQSCVNDSFGRDIMRNYLYPDIFGCIKNTINEKEKEKNFIFEPEFKEFMAKFYAEATAGILIDMAKEKDDKKREKYIEHISHIVEMQFRLAE